MLQITQTRSEYIQKIKNDSVKQEHGTVCVFCHDNDKRVIPGMESQRFFDKHVFFGKCIFREAGKGLSCVLTSVLKLLEGVCDREAAVASVGFGFLFPSNCFGVEESLCSLINLQSGQTSKTKERR